MKNNQPIVNRGDVYYANLSPSQGCEQGGSRPVVIVQNNLGNKHAPTTIIVPLTSRLTKKSLPTHIEVGTSCGLLCESVALCEQIRTIDKSRLTTKLGLVDGATMDNIDKALKISLGLA
jgi:mRNA interferase MazF